MWRITREITDGANTPSKNTAIKIKDKTWKAVYKKIDHIQLVKKYFSLHGQENCLYYNAQIRRVRILAMQVF